MNRSLDFRTAILALAVSSTPAVADIVATYGGPSAFSASITGMPDLDQFRDSLPPDGNGTGGGMYCCPTSFVNVFAYAANHGFPELLPGTGNWQAQANYPIASLSIAVAGMLMGTSAVDGTTGSGAFSGAMQYIANAGLKDKLCIQQVYSSGPQQWVRVHDIAKQVALGGVATLAYGRYKVTGVAGGIYALEVGDDGKLVRNGGHCITFESASPSGPFADYALTVRDPATPRGLDAMQSVFQSEYSDVFTLTFGGVCCEHFAADTMYWDISTQPGTIRLIDGVRVLRPCGALRFTSIPAGLLLSLFTPGSLGLSPSPVVIASPAGGLADLSFGADASDAYALVVTSPTSGATQLRRINLATGGQQPVGTLSTLRGIAVGRDGRVYAHDGTSVHAYRPDGTLERSMTPTAPPTALAYDDVRDRVVVLSVARRTVTAYDRTLAPVAEAVVPQSVPMSGAGSVSVSPQDGSAYFVTSASDALGRVGPGMTSADVSLSSIAGVTAPQRVACGDSGRLWVTSQGTVRAVAKDELGRWVQDTSSPFHLMPDQGPLAIMRSRTNFDPALHSGPGWREVASWEDAGRGLPLADCVADLNGNGIVDGADLGLLLANWGQTRVDAVSVSFDYVGNTVGSWASDLALVVNDGVHPTIGWGGYNSVLGAAVDAGRWPFYGSASAASGHYSATVLVPAGSVLSGAGPWNVTVGNGWTGSPAVQYRNVRVEPAGKGMPSLVTVPDQAPSGTQSVTKPFAIAGIAGDLNADGTVDGADLGIMLSAWGACSR
ncbi:MAG: hypothetical protein FJ260_09920 [Planctomycetes bacterium]|nr:hypothetical protein [Planctomycetota bacterium]